MMETEINLTEQERNALQEISQRTGRTENELVREAVGQFIGRFQIGDRRALMQQARGIWKGREDLPAFRELRNEWDRI
jgi:predicted transcriptional regulator